MSGRPIDPGKAGSLRNTMVSSGRELVGVMIDNDRCGRTR